MRGGLGIPPGPNRAPHPAARTHFAYARFMSVTCIGAETHTLQATRSFSRLDAQCAIKQILLPAIRAGSPYWAPPTVSIPYAGPTDWPSAVSESRSEEHTSELQSLMRISYAVFCL